MPLTQAEIDAFRNYAVAKVNNGGAESLVECLRLWDEEREYAESVAAIKEGLEDVAAGRTQPAHQVEAELRAEFGLRPRQPAS